MANDDALRESLRTVAASSSGRIEFGSTTVKSLSDDFGLELASTRNPLYLFDYASSPETPETAVAFTLLLDGTRRVATRAEALARSISRSGGDLFKLNPFLLIFDYVGERLLAVSAIELFAAFQQHSTTTQIPYSATSSFSMTPNFDSSTVNMYAEVRTPTVWATDIRWGSYTADDLLAFLKRINRETRSRSTEIPAIVDAIGARIAAAPEPAPDASSASPAAAASISGVVEADPMDEDVQIDDRLWQMILTAIASSPAVLLVGPPGTGKSALVRKSVATISASRIAAGQPGIKAPLWATPDESWTARELIGGETVDEGNIVFRPGWVLRAIQEDRWLILDEANRGDLDRIFGALLTWLSGGTVTVGVESAAESAKLVELGWTSEVSRVESVAPDSTNLHGKVRYLASSEGWKMLGTYNALDAQRVFRIGAALGRRFVRIPIPPLPPIAFAAVLRLRAKDLDYSVLVKVEALYRAHYEDPVTQVGPALFLGMCTYLRSAQYSRALPTGVLESSSSQSDAPPAEADPSEAGDARGKPEGSTDPPLAPQGVGWSSVIAEAYLLNLGTILAQLEEPDYDQLVLRIESSSALPQEEIEWVRQMTQALA